MKRKPKYGLKQVVAELTYAPGPSMTLPPKRVDSGHFYKVCGVRELVLPEKLTYEYDLGFGTSWLPEGWMRPLTKRECHGKKKRKARRTTKFGKLCF